jgi:hypothetical protein
MFVRVLMAMLKRLRRGYGKTARIYMLLGLSGNLDLNL